MRTVKRIGSGAFTKAYLMDNGRVLLRSCDPIKEAMAYGWFPKSEYFPEVSVLDAGVYEMQYYPKVRALKGALAPAQWEIYKSLRNIWNEHHGKCRDYSDWYKVFEREAVDEYGVPDDVVQIILEALNACSNYGRSVNFEISPRNVAAQDGQLVLLDCFYLKSALDGCAGGLNGKHRLS